MTLTQAPETKRVLQAINDLGRRVSTADVSTKTGLPLYSVTTELNRVAADTNGHLEVATTGDIVYRFDAGFQNAYLAHGIQLAVQQIGEKLFQAGYFLLRISFGIGLVLSALVVVGLIILVMMAQNRSDGDRDGGGISLDFFDYLILRDLFSWGMYSSTYSHPTIGYSQPYSHPRPQSNFLFDCFSFLFGDGDPNLHLEERRWQLVAQVIRDNDGVATAEQLAPYTGADPKNEDGVLPVLVRFDGQPEVTEKGNIIYRFPSLQVTTSGNQTESAPAFLREFPWRFTAAPEESLIPVYLLAAFNFGGSWWLYLHAHTIPVLLKFSPLISGLTVYGSLFIAVPLTRWLTCLWLNRRLERRNQVRQSYAHLLAQGPPELKDKLLEADQFKSKQRTLGADKIVYSTDKDALEQEFDIQR